MKNHKISIILIALIVGTYSCEKDKIDDPVNQPPSQNEEELITTVKLTFVDSAGVLPNQTFQFKDIDGAGGNLPSSFDTIRLAPNTTYLVNLVLLNESVSPAENISNEVLAEADEHLFCYTPLNLSNVLIQRTDSDGTYEIGLNTKWSTGGTETGKVRVVLKHQPGVKNGQCEPGDTDVELEFETIIQ